MPSQRNHLVFLKLQSQDLFDGVISQGVVLDKDGEIKEYGIKYNNE